MNEKFPSWFKLDNESVWVNTRDNLDFSYTDGQKIEKEIENAFRSCADLSSNSNELETFASDWGTKYHLSSTRKNIVEAFDFDRNSTVLEVGCGCGSITRLLGETFRNVVGVEGRYSRARLARLRNRNLENVEIVCSRFQTIPFQKKFDIVFCIGVLEYSPSFFDGPNPIKNAVETMKSFLKPGGTLILAIENQFGLKYFSYSPEDHTTRHFEGIEGYPTTEGKVETFGWKSLERILCSPEDGIDFYFPFPDYKTPSLILSEEICDSKNVGEMVGQFGDGVFSTTFAKKQKFQPILAWDCVGKNHLVKEFSNSFLVCVGPESRPKLPPNMLGKFYSRNRKPEYMTEGYIYSEGSRTMVVKKKKNDLKPSQIALKLPALDWFDQPTISLDFGRRSLHKAMPISLIIQPIIIWKDELQKVAIDGNGQKRVPGKYLDAIWQNSYIENGECKFFDLEYEYPESIALNVLFIRSCFFHLRRFDWEASRVSRNAATIRGKINSIAKHLDIELSSSDFSDFVELEADLQSIVQGASKKNARRSIALRLSIPMPSLAEGLKNKGLYLMTLIKSKTAIILGNN